MKFPSFYFNWLQKDNPTGDVEQFPALTRKFNTSTDGIYCTGDLTGIPLIKLAAESGYELIERFRSDESFRRARDNKPGDDVYDLLIVGAGPSGVSAALEARKAGYRFLVIEAARMFSTVKNFPRGKPIYVTPPDPPMRSELAFSDGTRESLLDELHAAVEGKDLPIHEEERVETITQEDGCFRIKTGNAEYRALRVVVAIGKTGNPRRLDVPGEDKDKVYSRLIDPGEHHDQDILVVGGGDSALEAAVALADTGNRVTLSYRRNAFTRPKQHNIDAFQERVDQGSITPVFESTVTAIEDEAVVLQTPDGENRLTNDVVFTLIGTEIPKQFFRRAGIRMEGQKSLSDVLLCALLVLFASVLYFGKKAPATPVHSFGEFLSIPARLAGQPWDAYLKGWLAWLSFILMTGCAAVAAVILVRRWKHFFSGVWNSFKYAYFITVFLLFVLVYLRYNLAGRSLLGWGPGIWYTAIYSLTIVVFGIRRIAVHPTGYIKRQTWVLMAFQVIPLFILPVFVLPLLGRNGWLGDWVMQNVFPGESYWRAYGLILAWPLFIYNLAQQEPIAFWLIVSLVQTFAIVPLIVFLWGKGAYCGWICSCGALAETLGDEYRTHMPHGRTPKRMDNAGQVVLWFAALVGVLTLASTWSGRHVPGESALFAGYEVLVDIVFAGVLGVGVYFFMSGRFWCRFLCPLAALMHIYARFSPYRIMSNKKRCISCNICTKVCHMGIDVMGYATRGVPMNDVECVRCSACIVNCPLQVLTFGSVHKVDLDNTAHKGKYYPLPRDWTAGLPQEDLEMLLEEEREKHPDAARTSAARPS